jgi:hypothetical protein
MRPGEVGGLVRAVSPGWPWWASLLVVLAWLAVYICRSYGRYRLFVKALDKVTRDRVPEVVAELSPRSGGRLRQGRASGPGPPTP